MKMIAKIRGEVMGYVVTGIVIIGLQVLAGYAWYRVGHKAGMKKGFDNGMRAGCKETKKELIESTEMTESEIKDMLGLSDNYDLKKVNSPVRTDIFTEYDLDNSWNSMKLVEWVN